MNKTDRQYQSVLQECRDLFLKKNQDYGTAWRVLRPSSLTDQIYIKAGRIRSIDQKQNQKIVDSIEQEFIGIINYCIMALIQLDREKHEYTDPLNKENAPSLYNQYAQKVFSLMQSKNHDYDEAWRFMRVSSMTDLILMKLVRIKEIEDKKGNTLVSEGIDANYMDIMNYSIFALILLHESQNPNF